MTPYKAQIYKAVGTRLAPLIWEGVFDWDRRYDQIYINRFSKMHGFNRTHLKETLNAMAIEIVHRAKQFRDTEPDKIYDKAKSAVLNALMSSVRNRGKYVAVKQAKENRG